MDKESQNIVWTAPSTWPVPLKVGVGVVTVGAGIGLIYALTKKNDSKTAVEATGQFNEHQLDGKTSEEKAQLLKAQGNKQFAAKQYAIAVEFFQRAIDLLKQAPESDEKTSNLAILYNNLSACMELQNDLNAALEYTNKAIELNPDYIKPFVRRARIYKLKKDNKRAISDFSKLFIIHAKTKESEKYLGDLAEMSNVIIQENVTKLYRDRIESEQFLPISQATTIEWMCQTVTHDPLLKLMHELGDEEPTKALDLALYHLKRHNYEQVLEFAVHALVDKFLGDRGRFLATLLASRIYFFAGLVKQARFTYDKLNEIWDNTPEKFKAENVDLLVALFVFKISVESPELVETELKQNIELCTGNADPFITLFITYYNLVKGEKAFEMLELAKKVEPGNPYIEFHEMSAKFLKATQGQDMLMLHNLTAEMDRKFRDNDEAPEFAILTAARIFHTVQNTQLAVEVLNKYKEKHSKRSIIFDYLHGVLLRELDSDRVNATKNLVKDLEELISRDPFNFEINRMLFRCQVTTNYERAADAAMNELLNARGIEEFTAAYHDVILGYALAQRQIPMEDQSLDYKGPEYIHSDSEANSMKFINSPLGAA